MPDTLPAANPNRRFDVWKSRVLGATRGVGDEAAQMIALACMDAEDRGAPTGVWHETSRFFGKLDRCPCWPCSSARGERAA